MYIITFINIFDYEKNHLIKILSSLIVKFSVCPSQELLQLNFINCYLREYISFTTKKDIRDWDQSKIPPTTLKLQRTRPIDNDGTNTWGFMQSYFCCRLLTFFKTSFFFQRKYFSNTIRVSNGLDPDQD